MLLGRVLNVMQEKQQASPTTDNAATGLSPFTPCQSNRQLPGPALRPIYCFVVAASVCDS